MTKPRGLVFKSNTPKPAYVPLGNPDLEIASWCPDEACKLPPEQVHLILKLPELEKMPIVVRFFSPDTLGFLIEELIRYRREVWPDCQTLETEADEIDRLRQICSQVRDWGIELASLLPAQREIRFRQLWARMNDALRSAQ